MTKKAACAHALTHRGYKIEFERETFPPRRDTPLFPYKRDAIETAKINEEILNLQRKDVIKTCHHEEGEFLSEIFTRPKKNGGIRLILDLSDLNKFKIKIKLQTGKFLFN